jgi:hypothetical protein
MINKIFISFFLILLPFYAHASAPCPTFNCPDDSLTPVAIFHFEQNFNDSSGHNIPAGDADPSHPATFYNNIGGRPGYSIGGLIYSASCVTIDSCTILTDEGELEWYEYITPSTYTNDIFYWLDTSSSDGIGIYPGDIANFTAKTLRVLYYYVNYAGTVSAESYLSEAINLNTWQHMQFQWGPWGTRLITDGIVVGGSIYPWDEFSKDQKYLYLGYVLSGYVDDVTIWPCSAHGTLTPTLSSTVTMTSSTTPTYTVTPTSPGTDTVTLTATVTPTITSTLSVTITDTVSPTSSASQTLSTTPTFSMTYTSSATQTYTMTVTQSATATATMTQTMSRTGTLTPTITQASSITPTITITLIPTATATAAESRLIGVFPNPSRKSANIIYISASVCQYKISIYTVSGELACNLSGTGAAGANAVEFNNKNDKGTPLSSGVYIYRLSLKFPDQTIKIMTGNFAIVR